MRFVRVASGVLLTALAGLISGCVDFQETTIAGGDITAITLNNDAVFFMKAGRTGKAMANLDAAIEDDPAYAGTYSNRGVLLGKLDKFQQAESDFTEAIRLAPGQAALWVNRCDNRLHLGKFDAALSDCNQALALQSNLGTGWEMRAIVYIRIGNCAAGRRDLDTDLRLRPGRPFALYLRGKLEEMADDKAAQADIAAGLHGEPDAVKEADQFGLRFSDPPNSSTGVGS